MKRHYLARGWLRLGFALVILLLAGANMVYGQTGGSYNLTWWTVDGGGGQSGGGAYTLFSSIGQPDAGAASGGAYSAGSGFLNSAVVTGSVTYNFTGFFPPVDNLPVLNRVNAGKAIPVKFSLGGNQGLNIFEAGYPKSQQITRDSTAPVDGIEETVTANASGLTYEASTDRYSYVWKTNTAWANACRQLVLKLNDGTFHRANFKFTR